LTIDKVLNDLINILKASDPYKIILFGSYANDKEIDDSDIDLMVILDNNDVAKNYEERQNQQPRPKGTRYVVLEGWLHSGV
jgi:predicted nucleotidyltransferase